MPEGTISSGSGSCGLASAGSRRVAVADWDSHGLKDRQLQRRTTLPLSNFLSMMGTDVNQNLTEHNKLKVQAAESLNVL